MSRLVRRATAVLVLGLMLLSLTACAQPEPADESAKITGEVKESVLGEDFSVEVTSTLVAEGAKLPLVGDRFAAKSRTYGVTLTWEQNGEQVVLGPIDPYEGEDSAASLSDDWAALDESFRGFILDKIAQDRAEGERIGALQVRPEGLEDLQQPGQGTEFDVIYIAPDGASRTESWQWRLPAGWKPPA